MIVGSRADSSMHLFGKGKEREGALAAVGHGGGVGCDGAGGVGSMMGAGGGDGGCGGFG